MAVKPWCGVWDDSPPADPLADWVIPWGDTPTGSATRATCCRGCPGVSIRACCSYDPKRAFAQLEAARGVKGRRRGDWLRRFLARGTIT